MTCISGLKDSILFQSRVLNSSSLLARTQNEGRSLEKVEKK